MACLSPLLRAGGAWQGQQLLEVAQIGHKRLLIALQTQLATLQHGHQVVGTGRRQRLPKPGPGSGAGAQGKGITRLNVWARLNGLDTTAVNFNEKGAVTDLEQKRHLEKAPTAHERAVGVGKVPQQRGDSLRHGWRPTSARTATWKTRRAQTSFPALCAAAGSSFQIFWL